MRVVGQGSTGPDSASTGRAVGIDLGTTHSLVAVFEAGDVRVLANELGRSLTPSVVALGDDGHLLVGDPAAELGLRAPDRAIARFKPDMGTRIERSLGEHRLTPIALSAMVLRELKAAAESNLGEPVERAVITVPAWFKEPQRAATVEAAELAGLHAERILNEPTAAAIAHGLHRAHEQAVVAVLDLGGGTFDVTLLEMFEGVVEVLASVGDTHLGGEDFTDALLSYALERLGLDPQRSDAHVLRHRVEQAKRDLTNQPTVDADLLAGRVLTIDRQTFEDINQERLGRIRTCITQALLQARLSARQVHEVLLVGGATRMPCIHAVARELFGRSPPAGVDVDHVVAHGAAVQAALLSKDAAVKDFVVTDVTPHSLGVAVSREQGGTWMDDYFSPILHRGTTIPVSRSETYSTIHYEQEKIVLEVYQGEHRKASFNEFLGQLVVDEIPGGSDPDDLVSVEVRFTHDPNGLLEVEATIPRTGRTVSTVIEKRPGSLSAEARAKAVAALQALKTPPRELLPNRYMLERAHRVFSMLAPEHRGGLDDALLRFEGALQRQVPAEIDSARRALKRVVETVEQRIRGGA